MSVCQISKSVNMTEHNASCQSLHVILTQTTSALQFAVYVHVCVCVRGGYCNSNCVLYNRSITISKCYKQSAECQVRTNCRTCNFKPIVDLVKPTIRRLLIKVHRKGFTPCVGKPFAWKTMSLAL